MFTNRSLERKWKNDWGKRALVNISAICWVEGRGRSFMRSIETFSRTTWQSISRCFIRSWKTGLVAKWRALLLSQYRAGCLSHVIQRLLSKNCSHCNSHVAKAKALYSSSELDRAIVDCLLECHVIKDSPRKKQYPLIDLRESGHSAQLYSL